MLKLFGIQESWCPHNAFTTSWQRQLEGWEEANKWSRGVHQCEWYEMCREVKEIWLYQSKFGQQRVRKQDLSILEPGKKLVRVFFSYETFEMHASKKHRFPIAFPVRREGCFVARVLSSRRSGQSREPSVMSWGLVAAFLPMEDGSEDEINSWVEWVFVLAAAMEGRRKERTQEEKWLCQGRNTWLCESMLRTRLWMLTLGDWSVMLNLVSIVIASFNISMYLNFTFHSLIWWDCTPDFGTAGNRACH